jgi:hypothetical protein
MAKYSGFSDDYRVHGVRLAGLVSNVLLILEKKPTVRNAAVGESNSRLPK